MPFRPTSGGSGPPRRPPSGAGGLHQRPASSTSRVSQHTRPIPAYVDVQDPVSVHGKHVTRWCLKPENCDASAGYSLVVVTSR